MTQNHITAILRYALVASGDVLLLLDQKTAAIVEQENLIGILDQQASSILTLADLCQRITPMHRSGFETACREAGLSEQQLRVELTTHERGARWFEALIRLMEPTPDTASQALIVVLLKDIHERVRSEKVQSALFQISEATHADMELSQLYPQLHRIISDLLPAKNLFFALYDQATELLTFPYYVDAFDPTPTPRRLSDKGLTQRVIRQRQAVLMTPDLRADRIAQGEKIVGTVCMDWLGVPLITNGEIIGAIVIQSYEGDVRYSEKDKELMQFVSSHVAAVLVRKRARDRITHQALHDALTQLPNRVLWQERLQRAISESTREKSQFALLFLDLNLFKPVNDCYGHAAGDLLLQKVAQRLQQNLRDSDTLARLGGDEFAVLLRQVKQNEDVNAVAAKLADAISAPFDLGPNTVRIGVSIGFAIFPQDSMSTEALSRIADQRLYECKRAGRKVITGSLSS
jgi:diguanylate cyclase (GGDEF)-like protein